MSRGRALFFVWLVLCSQVVFAEELMRGSARYDKYPLSPPVAGEQGEDFANDYNLHLQHFGNGSDRRVRAYEELTRMRRDRGLVHKPAGYGFEFKRQMWWDPRADAPGETDANGCAWTSAGPTNLNGRVTSIAIDPSDPNRVYVASVGGLWRSVDAGRRWQRVSDDFLSTVFASIAVNPGTPGEILAGGGDPNYNNPNRGGIGIWRSTAFGAPGTWTKVNPPELDKKVIYRLRIDPIAPNDIYVAASNGVWKGVHSGGGITFTRVGNFDATVNDFAVDFSASPRKIYAGVSAASVSFAKGIWKWDGAAWAKKDSGITTSTIGAISLALAKSNPAVLYAKIATQVDGSLQGVYKTTVAGEGNNAWSILPNAAPLNDSGNAQTFFYSWYNSVIEVDPTDANRVFAGGLNIWRTTNGGMIWEQISAGADVNYPYWTHADNHAIAFDPLNPKIVYLGNDGGLDKSTDTSNAPWHWSDSSHGMVMTEFYRLTSEREHPSLLAGGSQDNGTEITFGNRTWYNPGGCDGHDVGSDAKNPDTLYERCNQTLLEIANPIPGTIGAQIPINWVSPMPLYAPLITDPLYAGGALSGAGALCDIPSVVKTTDGVHWSATNTNFLVGARVLALDSAPTGAFQTYMAAVSYLPPTLQQCPNFQGFPFPPTVYRTDDGGVNWTANAVGLPLLNASSVAFNHNDKFRAYVTYAYVAPGVYMTTNATNYYNISGSGPTALPPSAGVWKLAADPFDPNVVYVATDVGPFRGVITPSMPPTAVWTPFDEGLPDGVYTFDITADPGTGVLSIATFGHGVYRRDIRPNVQCPARMLVIRDNVYDDAREPSPYGIPDAEHPIPDPNRPGFYMPDDTWGGRTYWWTSGDIRIDVPSVDPPAHTVPNADHVEFEVCPIAVSDCPSGTMLDSPPKAFQTARVYVQVANRGPEPATNARVLAVWAPTSAGLPPLPPSFWTQTFPANGPCGALDPSTGWQLLDPVNPCRTIATINPDLPELARFDWGVPFGADGHACILTVVESADDPLDPSIRAQNKLKPEEIVPSSRHIAQRNITIIRFKFGLIVPKLIPIHFFDPPEERGEVEVLVSNVDLRKSVRIALPYGMSARAATGEVRRTRIEEPELVRQLEEQRLDPSNAWEFSRGEASITIDMRPGDTVSLGAIGTPADERASSRFHVVERKNGKVIGGNVFLFRPEF